jgi:hypothetical protein
MARADIALRGTGRGKALEHHTAAAPLGGTAAPLPRTVRADIHNHLRARTEMAREESPSKRDGFSTALELRCLAREHRTARAELTERKVPRGMHHARGARAGEQESGSRARRVLIELAEGSRVAPNIHLSRRHDVTRRCPDGSCHARAA